MKRVLSLFASVVLITSLFSCKDTAKTGDNPFFESEWQTPYGVPPFDSIRLEHYAPALDRAISLHNEEIDAIVNSKEQPSFENTILALDNAGGQLDRVVRVFGLLNSANTDEQMQALSQELMPKLAAHNDAVSMNEQIFERVKSIYNKRRALGLDSLQMRLVEKKYKEFVRSGALLSAQDKTKLKQINEQLALLSLQFGENLLAQTNDFVLMIDKEDLTGIPASAREAAAATAKELGREGYAFTLQKPSMLPVLTYARRRNVREKIYKAYINRCNQDGEYDNREIISKIAALRCDKAKLLGYDSYADFVVSDQMAGSVESVYELLEGIYTPALNSSKEELSRMQIHFSRDEGKDATFESWDWWYYADKLRKMDYNLEEETIRQYLSLDNVKSGIFFLANRLYSITFRPLIAPVYHPECEVYEVIDADDKPLGVLYFDFHPRAGKRGGAWCGSYVPQSYKDGKRVLPVVSIVCNFTRSTSTLPALLSIDETETLFHEFGHALHQLFADVKYRGLADVEGDFVELPSQIMENWALSSQMLKQYAVHYRTGEVIPDDLIEKLHSAAKFNEGFMTTELTAAALADMDIHSLESVAEGFDAVAFERESLNDKRGLIPQIEPRYHYTYFSHIFDGGYSAGYYFYIWAEVLDKDAYQAFVESEDIFNSEVASHFRREILSQGGSRDGMTMYRSFRGADPDRSAMLVARGLIEESELEQPDSVELPKIVGKVDTRELARQRAERSRRERAEAKAKAEADSLAATQEVAADDIEPEAQVVASEVKRSADIEPRKEMVQSGIRGVDNTPQNR